MASTSPALSSNEASITAGYQVPSTQKSMSRSSTSSTGAVLARGHVSRFPSAGRLPRWTRARRVPAVVRACAERRHRRRLRRRRWSALLVRRPATPLRGAAVAGARRRRVLGGVLAPGGRRRRRRRAARQRVPHDRPAVAVDPGRRHEVGADADHGVRPVHRLGRTRARHREAAPGDEAGRRSTSRRATVDGGRHPAGRPAVEPVGRRGAADPPPLGGAARRRLPRRPAAGARARTGHVARRRRSPAASCWPCWPSSALVV